MPEKNDPLRLGRYPRWVQILIFAIAMIAVLGGIQLIASGLEKSKRDEGLVKYKEALEHIANQLNMAEKVGDQAAAVALLGPISTISQQFVDLDQTQKESIKSSQRRYCVLALSHLYDGATAVIKTGYWLSKDKYRSALDMCK